MMDRIDFYVRVYRVSGGTGVGTIWVAASTQHGVSAEGKTPSKALIALAESIDG